jgi:hypothetical protein
MDTPENNKKRQLLMEEFRNLLQGAVNSNSALSINGQVGPTWGEVMFRGHVFVYTLFPGDNSLNIQFGQNGMVKGTPAQAIFKADLVNNCWIERIHGQPSLTNLALVQDCINKLIYLGDCKNWLAIFWNCSCGLGLIQGRF